MSLNGDRGLTLDQEKILARLNYILPEEGTVAVALSGGADSKALTLLVNNWARHEGRTICALTVDHGLRPEAAREAQQMAEWCQGLHIQHTILTLDRTLPTTGIQEAARNERYRVMEEFCEHASIPALLVAHHMDDQAETVLMRLSRGSSIDGLGGMQTVRNLNGRVTLYRPLLDVPKQMLIDYLKQRDESWIEDPSNQKDDFTRVRLRKLMPALAHEGLNASRFVTLADRMQSVREALDWSVEHLAVEHLFLHEIGYAELLEEDALVHKVPAELLQRLIALAIIWANPGARIKLEKLETLIRSWKEEGCVDKSTLAGCVLIPQEKKKRLLVVREPRDLPVVAVDRDRMIWDQRFEISGLRPGQVVRALDQDGWNILKGRNEQKLPPYVVSRITPSVWHGEALISSAVQPDHSQNITFTKLGS